MSLYYHIMSSLIAPLRNAVNSAFAGAQPYQVCRDTLLAVLVLYIVSTVVQGVARNGARKYFFSLLLSVARRVPAARQRIEQEKTSTIAKLQQMIITPEMAAEERHSALPAQGAPHAELLSLMKRWSAKETSNWKQGQASGTVYHGGDELVQLEATTFSLFCLSNPLHPDVFCYVRKMEAEVVAMTVNLYHGSGFACGSMTSGGTESILMAMKACRDRMLAQQPHCQPELVCSSTAHAAFAKAAQYLCMKLVVVQVHAPDFTLQPARVKAVMTRNTAVIVGSAPAFPHGVIDPIPELSALALAAGVCMHVDCCLGSFLLPFLSSLSYPLPAFDFSLPGVTSISCDTHKYGYAVKGSSVIMYRSSSLRSYQYFVAPDWSGGIYASPSMPGSRPGGLIAATWVALMSMGIDGYRQAAREVMQVAKEVEQGVRGIEGLEVLGSPCMSVIAFGSTEPAVNIYAVNEAMNARHWGLNALQHPSALHLCVTYVHRGHGGRFVDDLRASVEAVRSEPSKWSKGSAAIYGMAAGIPDTSIVDDLARGYIDALMTV